MSAASALRVRAALRASPSRLVLPPLRPFTSSATKLQRRREYQVGFPGRGQQYERFQRIQGLKALWQQSPAFRYGVMGLGGLGGAYYYAHIEEVEVSGRRRFNVISPEAEEQMAAQMYRQTLQQYQGRVLPAWHASSRMVQRVLDRLIPASGLADAKWEVHVIDDEEQKNAFVMPGTSRGKVFVFSGILPICAGEDGLAAVLGHEIAHNVAHHAAERMSQMVLLVICLYPLAYLIGAPDFLYQMVMDFGFVRPGSRKQEAEADYIGLLMMAQSCYDPEAAIGLWQRMEQAEQNAPPQWMSTHPSSQNRAEKIREWLPQAEDKLAQSDCRTALTYSDGFKEAFRQVGW
ncbi:MAG: hypothetical protein M1832_000316 [Thelocarpon impressellum]|nr:MAG: hypothetical protein M1832_000316 [Thelocarpon impressellum]